MEAGAVAMSILTDRIFFGGSFKDLLEVREKMPDLALLRKDFMIDPYQLHEASAYGADMILLIASILERSEVADMALEARSLGLQVLLEVHSPEELEKFHPSIGFVGVNNRDLKTFQVDTAVSLEVIRHMPESVTTVTESGISSRKEILELSDAGFELFLIGETFMRHPSPGAAFKKLIAQLS
jgi:indole-3-glycerol phosphate synthase